MSSVLILYNRRSSTRVLIIRFLLYQRMKREIALFIGLINLFTHDLCQTAFGWKGKFI